MANEKKKSWRDLFNLFDVVVILIILALGAVLVLFSGKGSKAAASTVRYTVEFTNMQNGTASLIQAGDSLVDRVKKFDLGKVVSVEVSDTVRQVQDFEHGGMKEVTSETRQTATVVIEAAASETEQDILVSGGYLLKIGTQVSAKGPGYFCSGVVLAIERSDAQ